MPLKRALIAIACAFLVATSLAGCVTSDQPRPDLRVAIEDRITLPAEPTDLRPCFKRSFPEIPDADLTVEDVVRIIGEAKVLDRAKTRCGERAVVWIKHVKRTYGKPAAKVAK